METRKCQNCHNDFTIEPEDFKFYEKISVPPPTFCPECRFQRRLMFRNERNFYRRKCDLCNKDIIASYPADAKFPVYCGKCWWSDKWNPKEYAREYDFSRPFSEQLKELFYKVPVLAIMNDNGVGSTNCEWCYDWAFSKNVYLSACGWYVENGLYLYYADYDKDIMDCWNVQNSELVYEMVNSDKCSRSKYCILCFDSYDCILGYDLRGCSNCVMCVGLRNKSYCILNQQYSKEEYFEKLKELQLEKRSNLELHKKEFQELVMAVPRRFAYNQKTLNSTGDMLLQVKNSKDCFYIMGPTENSKYIVINDRAKDVYDCNHTGNPELCYDSVTPDNSRGNKFSIFCWKCVEAEYSNNCHSCFNVFGSSALKHVSYSILNKQYTKEDYIVMRDKIIAQMIKDGEWGEFFSSKLSPFAYDESAAIEWFPLNREEAISKGYKWKGMEKRNYQPTKSSEEIPETIAEVGDSFLNEIIACAHGGECNERCTMAFRVVPAELDLYRRLNIPLPMLCPNCRHYARLKLRNIPKLWHRACMCEIKNHDWHADSKCTNEFETSYAPERQEIVYCESCYNREV